MAQVSSFHGPIKGQEFAAAVPRRCCGTSPIYHVRHCAKSHVNRIEGWSQRPTQPHTMRLQHPSQCPDPSGGAPPFHPNLSTASITHLPNCCLWSSDQPPSQAATSTTPAPSAHPVAHGTKRATLGTQRVLEPPLKEKTTDEDGQHTQTTELERRPHSFGKGHGAGTRSG